MAFLDIFSTKDGCQKTQKIYDPRTPPPYLGQSPKFYHFLSSSLTGLLQATCWQRLIFPRGSFQITWNGTFRGNYTNSLKYWSKVQNAFSDFDGRFFPGLWHSGPAFGDEWFQGRIAFGRHRHQMWQLSACHSCSIVSFSTVYNSSLLRNKDFDFGNRTKYKCFRWSNVTQCKINLTYQSQKPLILKVVLEW